MHTSYGVTGIEIGTYKSLATVSQSNTIIGDALHVVSYLDNMPNPDLKWEKTGQWDLGFELGLFNNRLNSIFPIIINILQICCSTVLGS